MSTVDTKYKHILKELHTQLHLFWKLSQEIVNLDPPMYWEGELPPTTAEILAYSQISNELRSTAMVIQKWATERRVLFDHHDYTVLDRIHPNMLQFWISDCAKVDRTCHQSPWRAAEALAKYRTPLDVFANIKF